MNTQYVRCPSFSRLKKAAKSIDKSIGVRDRGSNFMFILYVWIEFEGHLCSLVSLCDLLSKTLVCKRHGRCFPGDEPFEHHNRTFAKNICLATQREGQKEVKGKELCTILQAPTVGRFAVESRGNN